MKNTTKNGIILYKTFRFWFFVIMLAITFILSKFIALDSFINAPEKVFLPENQWAISLFYKYKSYPISGNIYFIIDTFFAVSVFLFISIFYKWMLTRGKLWGQLLGESKSHGYYKGTVNIAALNDIRINKKLFFFPSFYLLVDLLEGFFNIQLINAENYKEYISLTHWLGYIAAAKVFFLIGTSFLVFYRYFSNVEIGKIFDQITGNSSLSIFKKRLGRIAAMLEGNYISILISLLIFYLILANDQGKTLLLEMVHSPINMIAGFIPLIIILSLMSLINSYYVNPIFYKQTKRNNDGQNPNKLYFNWLIKNEVAVNSNAAKNTREAKGNLKRYLTLIYYMMAAVLFFNLSTQTLNGPNIDFIGYILSAGLIIFIFYYIWQNNKQLSKIENKDLEANQTLRFKKKFARYAHFSGITTLILFILYVCVSCLYEKYDFLIWKMIILSLFFSMITFYVSHLILVRRSHEQILTSFSARIRNILAKDQNFIYLQWIIGILVILISILQFFLNADAVHNHVKSINIILIYVFLAFWLYFVISSTLLFAIKKQWTNIVIISNILIVFFITLFIYTQFWDNKYFTSKLITISTKNKKAAEGIKLKEYLKDRLEEDSKYFYLVANEGGGLKANYWSLLILNKLDSIGRSQGGFYKNTLATSGASGGSIGQSLFNLMKADGLDMINDTVIEKIGNTDHLSSDLYSLCFRRPIASMIPFDFTDFEKAKTIRGDYYAARRYARMATQDNMCMVHWASNMSFKSFWKKAYKNNNKHYPLTLINSTHAEYGTEGIGSPLTEEDNRKVFSSSVSYLEIDRGPGKNHKKQSISFIDAAFLANRFPIVSSPAIIPAKGHFIDAGAFDNNGVSSLMELVSYIRQKALENDPEWKEIWKQLKGKLKLIIIANGKGTYIKNEFDHFRLNSAGKLFKSGNLKNSLNAAVSTSAVKEYLQREAEKQDSIFDVIRIDLPFILKGKRKEVQATLKTQVLDTLLDSQIENANMRIRGYLNKRKYQYKVYLDPPLGRSLSKPVTTYMRIIADSIVNQKKEEIFD